MRSRTVEGSWLRRSPGPLPLAWLLVCVLSCGTRSDTPRLEKVSPESGPFGAPERLTLSGAFAPDLSVDLGSTKEPPSLENRFEVRIGPERAYGVQFVSRDSLEATAPATLPPGQHDITVTDAQGRSATLPGAFTVIDRDVQRLVFVTSIRWAHPEQWTEAIRLELRDDDGLPTPTSTPRTLSIASDSKTGLVALLGQEQTAEAELVVTLAPGESGVDLMYKDTTPGYHTLKSNSGQLDSITQTVAVGRFGPPTAVRFTRVPLSPLVAGQPVPLGVEVLDSSGGPASLPAKGLQLDLRTTSPGGGLAVDTSDAYHPTLSLTMQEAGTLSLLYKDTRSAAEVLLSVRAINQDTLTELEPHAVGIEVKPGPVRRLEVQRSGSGPLQVGIAEHFVIQALDEWGNRTHDTEEVLLKSDPFDPGFSLSSVVLEEGKAAFDAEFTRVQTVKVVATYRSVAGVTGASQEFSILGGRPTRLEVSPVQGPQRAGEPFELTIKALDRFGNPSETSMSVTLSAAGVPEGALSPTTTGIFTGSIQLPVTLTTAVEETHLELVEGTPEEPGELRTSTGGFAVRPGATRRFVVEDTPGAQKAGVPFRVRIRAVDAHGNTTRDVYTLKLGAENIDGSRVTPSTFSGFQGQADVDLTVTQSHPGTRVTVVSGDLQGQQAGTFDIHPGALVRFDVQAPDCIVERDRWKLTLRALDTWGNVVTSYTGTARLTVTPFGNISPITTQAFSAGTTTEPNVIISELAGKTPHDCLLVTATDVTDNSKSGSACISLQASCPAPVK
ncbi:hypothetical protein JQX13_11630 [Archangium violaceum]|uniref:IPT/TIG domain-containing protein n=1 Tax=Archangium violaceum TaxID=83451 RepID=UPI00193B26E5|nr:IPT/TIG domain-containing protein [Archangium violaceum]QRK10662.1 hypothetical protein JQX13_11630 [Archangium violaceum]